MVSNAFYCATCGWVGLSPKQDAAVQDKMLCPNCKRDTEHCGWFETRHTKSSSDWV